MAIENPRAWFRDITLKTVRSFGSEAQTIYFTEDGAETGKPARWNVILGDNGTGKTTVLKGLCLIGDKDTPARQLAVASVNRDMSVTGNVIIDHVEEPVWLSGSVQLNQMRNSAPQISHNYAVYNSATLQGRLKMFAFGAARRISSNNLSQEQTGIDSVSSLFDEQTFLTNAEAWLLEAELAFLKNPDDKSLRQRFQLIFDALKKLFKDEVSDIKSRQSGFTTKVYFETHYGWVQLHELSLGYKTLVAWMVEFAKGLIEAYPESSNPLAEPAVCLVDELDLHLHPRFQQTIISFLTNTFENTQFIVTAHSPLIVQAAEDENANVILLKREGDHTVVVNNPVDVRNWRFDQILTSELFGLESARSTKVQKLQKQRDKLLSKSRLSVADHKKLNEMENQIGQPPLGEDEAEIEAESIIRQLADVLRKRVGTK